MKISHGVRVHKWADSNGYGYATNMMLQSLNELGYEVNRNDPSADVQIWFDQPHHWTWNDNQYRIGYHPWESTELKTGWAASMNYCDEIWTPSPLIAQWYAEAGVDVPIYVYQHGLDHDVWTPKKRTVSQPLTFLHSGGEALRKGGHETLRAFRAAFPNGEDVRLTLKMNSEGWNMPSYGNLNIIKDILPIDELVGLYHESHVFVYPSWGEGFGLTPLQAMGTGMPVICTGAWAPYQHLLSDSESLKSELVDSPWPESHPGKLFQPDFDDLVDKMRNMYDNYDRECESAYEKSFEVHEEYDWVDLTNNTFNSLQKRL